MQSIEDGTILVVDQGDEPGLRRFEVSGKLVGPESPATKLQVVDPVDLTRDDIGRVYVLDRDGERVLRLKSDLTQETQILDLAEYLHDG